MQRGNESGILEKSIYVAAAILIIRLFFLQVLSPGYKQTARENVIKKVTIYPSRGLIIDRKGKVIVYNEAMYDVMIQLNITKDLDTAYLCQLLNSDIQFMRKKLKEIAIQSSRKPTPLIKLLDQETFARFQEHLFEFPSISIQTRTVRHYPFGGGASVLGYLSEVTENNIEQSEGYYELGDYMGTTGLESFYDDYLRGEKGYSFTVVDVKNTYKGKYKNGRDDKTPVSGWDMTTGIDIELQAYGEKLMQGKVGSIIAIEPKTGEIIAYVSSPGYDPNLLTGRYRRHNFNLLYKDPYLPLYNRPIQAVYPPGSTFKAPAAMIMLQSQTHAWDWGWFCHGGYRVGNHTVKCHGSHAIPDVQTALQYSCNSYFCKIYNDFIMDSVIHNPEAAYKKWWGEMAKFGYGKRLGIDLSNEKKGNLPTADYYNKVFGKGKWKASTIISNSIGQGEVLATPLQICNTMVIIANKGYYYTPKVCHSISKGEKKVYPKKEKVMVDFNPVYWNMVIDGLERVVLAGTARVAKIPDITFCGKTGTAQNPHGKDHSIFAGFAPKNNPQIAIAVFVENAGFGATYAAPIASLMVEKYLNDTIAKNRVPLQERMFNMHLIQFGVPDSIKAKMAKADSLKQVQLKKDSLQKIKLQQEANKNKNKPQTAPLNMNKPNPVEIDFE